MKLQHTLAAFAISIVGAQAGPIFTENFDGLTAAQTLNGQGGWSNVGGGNNVTVAADPGKFGFSGNIAQGGSDSQYGHAIPAGLNDTDIATIAFDLRINGDSAYTYWLFGSSVSLGVEYGNMTIRNVASTNPGYNSNSGGYVKYDHNLTGDFTYRMTMTIDPTAFSGAGSATVTFAQYTDEDTLGAATTAFSNIKLRLDETGRALSNISTSTLRIHNSGQIDNLSLSQSGTSPVAYADWALRFPSLTDTNPGADFDFDGLPTGIEWVVGGDPTVNDAGSVAPTFDNASDPDNFLYTYRRSDEANDDPGTAIVVEYGSDLAGWRNTADHGVADGVTIDETNDVEVGIDEVTVAIPRSLGLPGGKLFARLKVTITP